jgi:hypothetical protein
VCTERCPHGSGRGEGLAHVAASSPTPFSTLARSVLRRIRVASKAELADRIRRYIDFCNAKPLLPR